MSRAVLMTTPGDPFLNSLWFRLFQERWQDEIDKLYILVNSRIEKPVVDYLRKMYESNPKVKFYYTDHMIRHGDGLTQLVLECQEEYVMLAEDDGLIFKSGALDEQFKRIESGEMDVVGGHRTSATPGIADKTKHTFYCEGDEPFLWPCFLFTKLEYLKKTDLNFGAKGFKKGDYVKELDWTVTADEEVMDTFGWTAIQLYAQNLNIDFVEQYHAMGEDLQFYEHKQRMWEDGKKCKWVHFGSLSGMMTNFLMDKEGYPLESRQYKLDKHDPYNLQNTDGIENEGVKTDFESRVAHCWLAWEVTQKGCDGIDDFKKEYFEALERLIPVFKLRPENIFRKVKIYKELLQL